MWFGIGHYRGHLCFTNTSCFLLIMYCTLLTVSRRMKENKVIITFKLNNWLLVLNYYSMALRWNWVFWVQKANSTAFIAKIKEMPRSLFYDIPYATSQWVIRSETHLSIGHNMKNSLRLKLKVMSITCRCATPIKWFRYTPLNFAGE